MTAPRLGTLLGWICGAALCLAGACLAGACADREHIRDDFGVKTRAYLDKQRVHATAAQESPTGLDSEEAAMIQQTYRTGMSGDNATKTDESDQVMVIEQPKSGKSK